MIERFPKSVLFRVERLSVSLEKGPHPKPVAAALNRSTLCGGKRFRPFLTFLMGHFFDLDLKILDPMARAIERVHAASLAHDDVIDDATLRRGKPSINILVGNHKAVLAGDYLLSQVIADLCGEEEFFLLKELSGVIKDLSAGEWLQLDLKARDIVRYADVIEVAEKKTASVISWCVLAAAYKGGACSEVIGLSREMGRHLGIAFQLIDDTLDFSGDGEKNIGIDWENGVINSVLVLLGQNHPEIFEQLKKKEKESYHSFMSEETLKEAISTIRQKALIHLDSARVLMAKICEKSPFTQNKTRQNKAQFELVLEMLAKRSK